MDITLTMTNAQSKKLTENIQDIIWEKTLHGEPFNIEKQRVTIPLISIVDVDGNHHCSLDPERDIKLVK